MQEPLAAQGKLPLFRPFALLLYWMLSPAAIARPIPAHRLQPLTLEQDSVPEITAQAEPPSKPAIPPAEADPIERSGPEASSTEELTRAAQNPIANLISLPFQNNTYFGVGPLGERTQNVLNIQPVIPVPLSKDLLLVTRTIFPYIYQPTSASGRSGKFGLGDINPQFYFSPRTTSAVTWGVGPTFVVPSATQQFTGQGKWSAGPAAVVVVTTKHMVFGAVGNNVWSFAGSSQRKDVNQMLVQPFLNYNLSSGWYLVSAPIITANWQAPEGDEQWTVPVGGGFGRVFAIGEQKVNATLQAYWNAVRPEEAGDWTLRAQFQFLFPKR